MKKFSDIHFFVFPETLDKSCPLVLNCGHEEAVSRSYYFDGGKRFESGVAIWQYTLSGQGVFEYGGCRYEVNPGQAFIALVPEEHLYYLPKNSEKWEFIFLTLVGENSINLFREYRRRFGAVVNFSPESMTVKKAWELFFMAKEREIKNVYQLSELTYSFIMQMFADGQMDVEKSINVPAWLRKVRDYCAGNIDSDIMIEDLAAIAGCSKWHFSRQFALYEGVSPHRYLTDLRIKSAVRLLENSTLSIKEIAEKCGFYDLAYFGKVFKSYMNVSPEKYRKLF